LASSWTPSERFQIPGYSMTRCDRHQCSITPTAQEIGGGLAIYIKNGVLYDEYTFSEDAPPRLNLLCIVVRTRGVRLGVCVVYRPSYVRYTHLSTLFLSFYVYIAAEVNSVKYFGDTDIGMMNCVF
jgi:hypothetical protein